MGVSDGFWKLQKTPVEHGGARWRPLITEVPFKLLGDRARGIFETDYLDDDLRSWAAFAQQRFALFMIWGFTKIGTPKAAPQIKGFPYKKDQEGTP